MPLFNPAIQQIYGGTVAATARGPVVQFANGGGVSFGVAGNTVTATVQAGAAAGIGAAAAGTQTQTSGTLKFVNSNGMSFGMSNSSEITGSFAGIKSISGGTTRATDGEVVFANSNGISFGMNGNTMTMSNDAFREISAGTTFTGGTDLSFANSNRVSFGLNGATITANADPGMSFCPLFPLVASGTGVNSIHTNTSSPMSVYGFTLDRPLATNASLGVMFSFSYVTRGTSAGSNSMGVSLGLFSFGTGTQSTRASRITSWSFGVSDSYSNSTLTVSFPTNTSSSGFAVTSVSSAGLNVTSQFTGLRRVNYDLGQTLPPGHYLLAIFGTQSSSSVSGGPKASLFGNVWSQTLAAPLGVNNYTTGTRVLLNQGSPYPYIGSWTAANLSTMPGSIALSDLTISVSVVPHALFFVQPS